MKRVFSFTVLIFSFFALFGCPSGTSEPKKEVEEYITALMKSDFQTLYEMNATAQRKAALIYRGEEAGREESLKKNFEENKEVYTSAQADGVYQNQWTEKFLFPAESKHNIIKINVQKDTDSPTAKFKNRMISIAEVSVEYPNRETAPVIEEKKVKGAKYTLTFISGEDVVRGLKSDKAANPWLFKSLSIKNGEVSYW